jgi:myo-inositol-1(or 4)-monophosphatase
MNNPESSPAPDPAFAIALLREVGAGLKQRFAAWQAVHEVEDMMRAFRALDDAAVDRIASALQAEYPDVAWVGDELKGADAWEQAKTGRFWACDPVDGAVQFLRAIPQWCISLTLVEDGQAALTVIFDAVHDELFHAIAGGGAFLNGRPITVNARRSHVMGVLATSQPPFVKDRDIIALAGKSLAALVAEAGAVRNLGPTSLQLAYVACGRLDAFWEYGEDTFNCLGGSLLVREAGGVATAIDGAPYALQAEGIVAAPAPVHATVMARLAGL